MNNRNSKIFKFPRKEMQVSQEINKRKGQEERQKGNFGGLALKIMKNQPKEGIHLVLSKERDISEGKIAEGKVENQRVPSKNSGENSSRSEQFMRMSEKGVLFDKKLTKLVLPDHIEKLKLVSKIENKLLSCLEKKKSLIPMKQLVNLEMLNEILGRKQRRLITDRQQFCENLEVEAHSLRKNDEKSAKNKQKTSKNKQILSETSSQAEDPRLKMKLMPLRVPVFNKPQEQIPFFQEQSSNFIFQQAPAQEFNFFNQEDTIFDGISNQHYDMSNNFGNNYPPKSNNFKERKSKYIERQSKSSFFANINEYEYDESLFKNHKRHPSESIFHNNNNLPRVPDNDFPIGRLRLPRQQQPRHSESNSNYGIFPIEEETSHFFSPEKQQRQMNNKMGNGRYQQVQNYWRGKQSSSGSSATYY